MRIGVMCILSVAGYLRNLHRSGMADKVKGFAIGGQIKSRFQKQKEEVNRTAAHQ